MDLLHRKAQSYKFSNENDLFCAWRDFNKTFCGISTYHKWLFKLQISSIFNFDRAHQSWISGLLGFNTILKPLNETASPLFSQIFYCNSLIKVEIKPSLLSCTFIFYQILYCAFFIISMLVGIDKDKINFENFWNNFFPLILKIDKNSQNFIKIWPKTVLFRNIALIFSSEKPCYLENRVVREPCRTACTIKSYRRKRPRPYCPIVYTVIFPVWSVGPWLLFHQHADNETLCSNQIYISQVL